MPDAFCKIYLTASVEARATRRFHELNQKGVPCNFNEIKSDIQKRDYEDMNREISPLKQADDAVLLDTSDMGIEEVLETIIKMIQSKKLEVDK